MKQTLLILMAVALVGCGYYGNNMQCYWCKEDINIGALVCKHCGKSPNKPSAEELAEYQRQKFREQLFRQTGVARQTGVKPKPVKELTLEEQVVGTYEVEDGELAFKMVFLDGGVLERYIDDKKDVRESKWKMVAGEIHTGIQGGSTSVWRINSDGGNRLSSITAIAFIKNGIRSPGPPIKITYKKIK